MATDTIIRASLSYRDAKGFIGKVLYHVAGDSTSPTNLTDLVTVAENFRTAVDALTNGANQTGTWPFTAPTLAYGAAAAYIAEWQKAVMTFTNDREQITRFKIPAPKLAILEADEVTVINDGTNAAVVAFINAVKNATNASFICNASGEPYTHFVGGIVRLGKQPRRFNEFVKSAKLVAGEGE